MREAAERAAGIPVVRAAEGGEGRTERPSGHCKRAVLQCRHAGIHILYGLRAVEIARETEVDLEVAERFYDRANLQVLRAGGHSGGDDTIRLHQPSAVGRTMYISFAADGGKGEVQSGRKHSAGTSLSEGITHIGHKAGEVEARRGAVGEIYIAHHHQCAATVLGYSIPGQFLGATLRHNGHLHREGVAIEDFNAVHIEHLVAHREACTVGTNGHDAQFLRRKVVYHYGRRVGAERNGAFKGLFLLRLLAGCGTGREFAVDLFEERHLIIERFEAEA